MTRSDTIKLLGNAAFALKSLQKASSSNAADSQLKIDILQLILQILQAVLAQQGVASAELTSEDSDLLAAATSILDSIRSDMAAPTAHAEPNVEIGGLQVDILQLIIQVITAVLSQHKPATTPVAPSEAEKVTTGVIRPRLTSDSITYTIDSLGRLTKLTYASGHIITFNYDAAGNRTSVVTT